MSFDLFNDPSEEDGIDLTPLIDVVFMLLIFFVLSTVFVKPGIEVDLPTVDNAQAARPEKDWLVISIDAVGKYHAEGGPQTMEELLALLAATPDRESIFRWINKPPSNPSSASSTRSRHVGRRISLSRQPATTSRTESRCRKVGLGASLIVHLALAFCLVAAPLPSDSPSPVRQVDMSVVRLQLCQVMPPAPAPSTLTPPAPKPKPKPKPELNPQPQPEPKPQPQAEPKPEPTDCDPAPPDTEPEESAETETVTAEPPAPSPPGPEASVGRPGQEDGVRNLLLQLTTLIGEEKYYPYTARRMNLEGQAYMTIDIDRYGTITGFQVESTSSAIFEKAAKVTMERVKKKFKPQGLHFDKEFRIRVPIAYRLVE